MGERSTLESCASQPESVYVPRSSCSAASLSILPTTKVSSVNPDNAVVRKSPRIKRKSRIPSTSLALPSERQDQDDVQDLLGHIPEIREEFTILSKIGEGTFSSVYLACLKDYSEEKFAIKHLVPTSSSSRIENELRFLQLLGGKDNVIPICTCLRHRDHIVLIMPYFQHDRFPDYLPIMSLSEARDYMRALFVALRNIHSHHIIHRDIKPSNFLYNRTTKQFQLVDFGLAHLEPKHQQSKEEHIGVNRTRLRSRTSKDSSVKPHVVAATSGINSIIAPPSQTYQRQVHHRTTARALRLSTTTGVRSRTTTATAATPGAAAAGRVTVPQGRQTTDSKKGKSAKEKIRVCPLRHSATEVCNSCMGRSNQAAPRAGTPGFRAPEVLLKCPSQTTAVDIWSAGVILLSILSGRYPFFRAHNDLSALAQIIGLMGTKECIEAANSYGKTLVCEPHVGPTDLKELCKSMRASLSNSEVHDGEVNPTPPKKSRLNDCDVINTSQKTISPTTQKSPRKQCLDSSRTKNHNVQSMTTCNDTCKTECCNSDSDSWNQVPESAFSLLHSCLDLNPVTRITAEQALQHAFICGER